MASGDVKPEPEAPQKRKSLSHLRIVRLRILAAMLLDGSPPAKCSTRQTTKTGLNRLRAPRSP
jgi:hypothetical protein